MLFLIALGALSTSAFATNIPGTSLSLSSNVSYTSEYIFRGAAESNGDPAIQGGFDLDAGGFYAGVWSSNVAWSNLHLEMDFYGGYHGEIENMMRYDLSAILYRYPGATGSDDNFKFNELAVAVSRDLGPVDTTLSLNYSPDYFGFAGKTYYTKLHGKMPISGPVAISASIGNLNNSDDDFVSYTDYLASLSYTLDNYTLAVTYTNTSIASDFDPTAGANVVVSLSASL